MNITLIGGSGFVGTRLATRLLAANHNIVIADKNDSRAYPQFRVFADVREPESLEKALLGSDVAINLAAEHRDDVTPNTLYDDVNVSGAENVCAVCSSLGIKKIIFTSSVAVYGFAPLGTNENGSLCYFNDYGRTKLFAEEKYRAWLSRDTSNSLTVIRPTVIFGECNRGNVYNLLRQISCGFFPLVGTCKNVKSMAYVENVAAFIEFNLHNGSGYYLYNYIDKPDFNMNTLVSEIRNILGKKGMPLRLPYWMAYSGGLFFDVLAKILHRKFSISSIRVKKFCANTMFESSNIKNTGFVPPVSLREGLEKTVRYEFIDKNSGDVFYTE